VIEKMGRVLAVIAGNEEATVVTKDGQLALRRARSLGV
jgi:hypothetical protein